MAVTWLPIDCQQITPRRFSFHNIIRETSGPSNLAQRSIAGGVVCSSWKLLIDESMFCHIQRCAEEEARRVLQNDDWFLSLNKLNAFILIIHAHGVYGATKLKLHELWNRLWGPLFFVETMSRIY